MFDLFKKITFKTADPYKVNINESNDSLESQLQKIPRFTECHVQFNKWNLVIPDSASFLSAYKEIFTGKIYDFKHVTKSPKILDLGANIGLSVLFFKSIYPDAKITALEADPKIFEYLKNNIHGNGFSDVELINKAAWFEETTLRFNSDGADGGRVAFESDDNILEICAIDIAEYIKNNNFDFIKMDIEGAEIKVVPSCKNYLSNISYIFIEYHSRADQKQNLDEIMSILSAAGFRIHVHSIFCSSSPFINLKINSGFDLQLNIFGFREKC